MFSFASPLQPQGLMKSPQLATPLLSTGDDFDCIRGGPHGNIRFRPASDSDCSAIGRNKSIRCLCASMRAASADKGGAAVRTTTRLVTTTLFCSSWKLPRGSNVVPFWLCPAFFSGSTFEPLGRHLCLEVAEQFENLLCCDLQLDLMHFFFCCARVGASIIINIPVHYSIPIVQLLNHIASRRREALNDPNSL